MKKLFCTLLALVSLFSFVSCKKAEEEQSSPSNETEENTTNSHYDVEELSYDFVKNGESDFKLVVPADMNSNEANAVSELNFFLDLSVGTTLPVVKDNQVTFDNNQKYISIGRTSLFNQSGIETDEAALYTSGYAMTTIGNTLYLYGSNLPNDVDYGVIYAAYGFLEEMINLKLYTADCYTYDTSMRLTMKAFDVLEIPDYDERTIGTGRMNTLYAMRTKTLSGIPNLMNTVHSHIEYLPLDKYYEQHPEWYAGGGSDLRLANEEMRAEFIEQAKQYLRDNPTAMKLFFGIEDIHNPLNAEDTKLVKEKYNTNQSGLNIVFCNAVVEAIEEWLPTEFPGRYVEYETIAYYEHTNAPVDYDEETDTFTPHSEWVIPHEKLRIQIAYMNMPDWGAPLTSESNAAIYQNLRAWASICDNFSIYGYGINFNGFLVNFPAFQSWEWNTRFGYESGYKGYYELMASGGTATPALEELTIYVRAKMLWDTSLHYEDLVEEFIEVYYQEAAPQVLEYVKSTYTHLAIQDVENTMNQSHTSGFPLDAKYWPFEWVEKMSRLLDEGEKQYEPLKETDPEQYEIMLNRIRQQKVTVQYLQMKHYYMYYDKTTIKRILDEMYETVTKNGFIHIEEDDAYNSVAIAIEEWRLKYL